MDELLSFHQLLFSLVLTSEDEAATVSEGGSFPSSLHFFGKVMYEPARRRNGEVLSELKGAGSPWLWSLLLSSATVQRAQHVRRITAVRR